MVRKNEQKFQTLEHADKRFRAAMEDKLRVLADAYRDGNWVGEGADEIRRAFVAGWDARRATELDYHAGKVNVKG